MHSNRWHSNRWKELIPFYVAGTLSRRDAAAFERHLATCAECRRDVDEWGAVASAVRAESASQLRDLPPLAPDLQARISGSTLQGGAQMPRSAYHPAYNAPSAPQLTTQPLTTPLPFSVAPSFIDRERRTRASRIGVSLSLAAAAAMVIGFAVLLAARTMDNLPNEETTTPFIALSVGSETLASPTQDQPPTQTAPVTETEAIVFATATPSRTTRPPATATATITLNQPTPTQQDQAVENAQVVAEVVVTSTTINLRGGPGTNYPILETGNVEDRYRVVARVGSGSNTWYLVERPTGGAAWVFGTIVRLEPADAQIPPASDIPDAPEVGAPINVTNTPSPAETTPQPSASAAPIRGGNWMHLTTVVEHQCGGAIGTSSTVGLFIVPSLDLSTVTVTYTTGVNFVLFRTTSLTYSGSYPDDTLEGEGTATVSVSITFNAPNSYTGQETILHEDGCIVRSIWVGSAVN